MPRWTRPTPPFVNAESGIVVQGNRLELHLGGFAQNYATTQFAQFAQFSTFAQVHASTLAISDKQSHIVELPDMHSWIHPSRLDRDTDFGTFQLEVLYTVGRVENGKNEN